MSIMSRTPSVFMTPTYKLYVIYEVACRKVNVIYMPSKLGEGDMLFEEAIIIIVQSLSKINYLEKNFNS